MMHDHAGSVSAKGGDGRKGGSTSDSGAGKWYLVFSFLQAEGGQATAAEGSREPRRLS